MVSLVLLFTVTLSVIMFVSTQEIRQKNMDVLNRYASQYSLEKEKATLGSRMAQRGRVVPRDRIAPRDRQAPKIRVRSSHWSNLTLSCQTNLTINRQARDLLTSSQRFTQYRFLQTALYSQFLMARKPLAPMKTSLSLLVRF